MNPEIQNPIQAEPDADMATSATIGAEREALLQEISEQRAVNVRLAADFESYKRRTRQDMEARAAAQKDSFILELLPVIDNLERALASGASNQSHPFFQGVAMTLQQMLRLLQQQGVEVEACVGRPFDPYHHEAISQRRHPALPDQTILEVLQRGYTRGGKVFRPAKVVVNDLTHREVPIFRGDDAQAMKRRAIDRWENEGGEIPDLQGVRR